MDESRNILPDLVDTRSVYHGSHGEGNGAMISNSKTSLRKWSGLDITMNMIAQDKFWYCWLILRSVAGLWIRCHWFVCMLSLDSVYCVTGLWVRCHWFMGMMWLDSVFCVTGLCVRCHCSQCMMSLDSVYCFTGLCVRCHCTQCMMSLDTLYDVTGLCVRCHYTLCTMPHSYNVIGLCVRCHWSLCTMSLISGHDYLVPVYDVTGLCWNSFQWV